MHVAAESHIAWATLSKQVARNLELDEAEELIEHWRREKTRSARRITRELDVRMILCCLRTVTRWLDRLAWVGPLEVQPRPDVTVGGPANKDIGIQRYDMECRDEPVLGVAN